VKSYFSGLRAWLLQRATALYLLGFIVYVALHILASPPASYDAWRSWVLSPGPRVAILLFFIAVALHAWVGLRDVAIDYIKPLGLRLSVLGVLVAGLAATVARAAALLFP
jgi:succinate dehydrogenase / fumarate reductase membrane anchor subunit